MRINFTINPERINIKWRDIKVKNSKANHHGQKSLASERRKEKKRKQIHKSGTEFPDPCPILKVEISRFFCNFFCLILFIIYLFFYDSFRFVREGTSTNLNRLFGEAEQWPRAKRGGLLSIVASGFLRGSNIKRELKLFLNILTCVFKTTQKGDRRVRNLIPCNIWS